MGSSGRFQELLAELRCEHERELATLQRGRHHGAVFPEDSAVSPGEDDAGPGPSLRSSSCALRTGSLRQVQPLSPVSGDALIAKKIASFHSYNYDDSTNNSGSFGIEIIPIGKHNSFVRRDMWTQLASAHTAKSRDLDYVLAGSSRPEVVRHMKGDKVTHKSQYLIKPSSFRRMAWDMFGLVLIVYDLITIPMTAFEMQKNLFATGMDWLTLGFWSIDMVQSFFLGYYHGGELITNHCSIAKKYLKGWFFVDIIVVVPDWFVSLMGNSGEGDFIGLGRILRVGRAVRMLRLLRLLKLQKIINSVYDRIDSEYTFIVINLCRLLVCILSLNHVIACAWFYVGNASMNAGEVSWVEHAGYTPVAGEDFAWKYTTSLHWSLTQFTPASMDISARNVTERLFSIMVLFFAMVAFGTIVGSVTASMTSLRKIKGNQVRQFWLLRRYLKQERTPKDLCMRLVKFLEAHEEHRCMAVSPNGIKILEYLSEPLQNELANEMYKADISSHPLFDYLIQEMRFVMNRIGTRVLQCLAFAAKDTVFNIGEEANLMYFIKSGVFGYEFSHGGFLDPLLQCKDWLSEPALWTLWRHRGCLWADDPSELIAVNPLGFAEMMKIHPRPWHLARHYAHDYIEMLNGIPSKDLCDVVSEHMNDFYSSSMTLRSGKPSKRELEI